MAANEGEADRKKLFGFLDRRTAWYLLSAGVAIGLWVYFSIQPPSHFSGNTVWDNLASGRLVYAAVRVALLAIAAYVVFSVVYLTAHGRPLSKLGLSGGAADTYKAENSKKTASFQAQSKVLAATEARLQTSNDEVKRLSDVVSVCKATNQDLSSQLEAANQKIRDFESL